jgi:hypothetical protein
MTKPEFPALDCAPSMANSVGQFNHKDSTLATPIDDVEAFVADIESFRDEEHYDDDLETMSWVVMTLVEGLGIKFSGVFANKSVAVERAKEVSLDLFNVYVLPFGRWTSLPVGSTVSEVARKFAETYNDRIDEVKRRLERTKEDKAFDSHDDFHDNHVDKDPEEAKEADVSESIVQKMQRAIQRGDATKHKLEGQKFVVIANAGIDSTTSLLRVCHYGDDAGQVETTARRLYEADSTSKRVDYLVARMGEFKPWPPNFLTGVERTIVPHNPSQQRLYEASMMQQSDEYQSSLKEIEKFHKQNESEAKAIEASAS